MKISYNWLKNYLDLDISAEEAAEKLTLMGLEVDDMESFGANLDGVIVGEVTDCRAHPNADRLWLCQVNLGSEEVQIVCGADNVAKGQKVPVATVGTELPVQNENGENLVVRDAELHGEKSKGMICAEDELGLGDNHEGIMILEDRLEPGISLTDALDIEEDTIFDIELTPNRPDASCHIGVARDLAAALDKEIETPYADEEELSETDSLEDYISIDIKNPDKCHRYVGKIIEEVTIQESPRWLKNHLRSVGLRPINNIVDVTNYVLHEVGQPLHAFDYDLIEEKSIIVRDYKEEKAFTTLDEEERTLSPGSLFICDGKGPVALAGIMGGLNTEISAQTQTVFLESAYFAPESIRRTAREQALQTDSSYRFERGIDPNMTRTVAERAARLIAEVSGGKVIDGCTDVHPIQTQPVEIELRIDYLNNLLGTEFKVDEAAEILDRLELNVVSSSASTITCRIPTFRPDLTREVDLIEEIGRVYDYNNITSPDYIKFPKPKPKSSVQKLQNRFKDAIKSLRFKEINTNSLLPEKEALLFYEEDELVHTLNPVSRDMAILRPTLVQGFLQSVAYNFKRKAHSARFFEVGNTFAYGEEGTYFDNIVEETSILLGLSGYKHLEHWKTEITEYDLFDLKEPVNTLLQQLGIYEELSEEKIDQQLVYTHGDSPIGRLYPVKDDILDYFDIEYPTFVCELSFTRIKQLIDKLPEQGFKPIPKFPTIEYDIAVVTDKGIPAGDLIKTIKQTTGERLHNLEVFDVFEGESLSENKKSVAFRFTFLDRNKTLTLNDIEPIINKVLKALESEHSAKLRS